MELIESLKHIAESAGDAFGHLKSLFAMISGVLSALAFYHSYKGRKEAKLREQRAAEPILIRLFDTAGHCVDLPYKPRRDALSRAELLGVLGMYSGKERFELRGVRTALDEGIVEKVRAGTERTIEIAASPAEFAVFRANTGGAS